MATININSEVTDQFYRYKMPRLIAKVEGKGNGIKTVIVNMPEIAKALSRPPTYPTKYFGCELGAQTMFDFKNERFIVNGSHDPSKLQSLLDGFIKRFVLCPECSNPETQLTVFAKKGTISQRCIACGYTGMVDMRHKLTTFILKNPPDQDPAATPTKQTKKDKKNKKAVNGEKKDDRASPEANAQEQMAQQRASGGVVDAPPVVETNKDENDDDWGEDFSEEAVRERMQELSIAAKQMAFTDDLEKTQEERLNMFYKFVVLKRETFSTGGDKEVVAEAERLEIKDKAPLILVEVLLDVKILPQLKQYRNLFLRFCHENPKAQKYMLGGIEQLVGNVHKEELLPKVPHILKALYDLDIIDEEVLLEWGKKASKKYVDKKISAEIHEKAAPFINWLKEAEEDDSEEEEEEEDQVEVVYSNFEKVGQQEAPKPAAKEAPSEEDEEDDLDIDDI